MTEEEKKEQERLKRISELQKDIRSKPQLEEAQLTNTVYFDPFDNENSPPPEEETPKVEAQKEPDPRLQPGNTGAMGMPRQVDRQDPEDVAPKVQPVDGKYTIKGVEYDEEDIEFWNGHPFPKREARKKYAAQEQEAFEERLAADAEGFRERISAPGMGLIDFGMDLVGEIPGLGGLDDAYDEATKYKDPFAQKLRELSSIILPAMLGTSAAVGAIGRTKMPLLLKRLSQIGATGAVDAAVTHISDTSEEGDNLLRTIDDLTGGALNIPDNWKTLDSDGPELRRRKMTADAAGFSIFGSMIGYGLDLGKVIKGKAIPGFLDWLQGTDDASRAYKAKHLQSAPDVRPGEPPLEARIRNDESLREWQIDEAGVRALEADYARLGSVNELMDDAVFLGDNIALQSARDRQNISDAWESAKQNIRAKPQKREDVLRREMLRYQQDAAAQRRNGDVSGLAQVYEDKALKLKRMLEAEVAAKNTTPPPYNPTITSKLASEASNAVLPVPPAAVVRNAVDLTTIRAGITPGGSPASVITEPTLRAVAGGNIDAHELALDMAADSDTSGAWEWIINQIRGSKADTDQAAMDILTDALEAPTLQGVQDAFYKLPAQEVFGGRAFTYASEDGARAAAFGLKRLFDVYLGEKIAMSSSRLMATTATEMRDIGNAAYFFPNMADDTRIKMMLLDRAQVLMSEYGLNKYVSGWKLQNKGKILKEMTQSAEPDAVITRVMQEFDNVRADKARQSLELRNSLEELIDSDPAKAKALIDAFTMSDGDITTIDKMMKWARSQMSLRSLIYSPEGMSVFAKGMWAVRYNNVLSGLSALRAGIGNTTSLILKSLTAIGGHGLEALFTGSAAPLREAMYTYGGFYETNRRAMLGFWNAWKRTNDDPSAFMDLMRKDRVVAQDSAEWEMLENIATNVWAKENNHGRLLMWNWTKANKRASEMRGMRWGTNAMISADQYVNVTLATQKSRMLAYNEVFQQTGGKVTKKLLRAAEEKHYAKMFDSNGLIKDEAVKMASSELALNQDSFLSDGLNFALNRVPVLKTFFMFPRTGINAVRLGLSYIPVANIAGNRRIAKVLLAGKDQDKIAKALVAHGVKADDPAAMTIFKNLRAEYQGRMALGSMILASGLMYAHGGNIRGNGPVNANERKLMRDNFGWQPKTIKIGNKWVSYAGIEPFDSLLTLVGDLAYYKNDLGSNMTDQFMQKALWTISAGFTNKTFMAGLEPAVKFFSGDTTQISRYLANEARAYIPMSGALGVFANSITSAQKDIHNDMIAYVANRIPIAKAYLPDRIDVWTGRPINDIDNHFLRALNAFNPVPISDGAEPWRQWMMRTGWDGMQLLRRDSTGKYEYTPAERQELYQIMGKMQLWKQVDKLSKNPVLNAELEALRRARADNVNFSYSDLRAKDLRTYRILNRLIRNAQKQAEMQLLLRNPTMQMKIEGAQVIQNLLRQGRVEKARQVGEAYQVQLDQIVQD